MDFVDDVDLVARLDGRIAHRIEQIAHGVDARARGGVEFEHVDMPAFDDRLAVAAHDAQVDRGFVDGVAFVVERPGQQARRRRLADAAHAGQHEGVGDTVAGEGVGEGAHHGFLADQVLEGARAVLARQDGIGLSLFRRLGGGDAVGGAEHVVGRGVTLEGVGLGYIGKRVISGVAHTGNYKGFSNARLHLSAIRDAVESHRHTADATARSDDEGSLFRISGPNARQARLRARAVARLSLRA